MIWQLVVSVGMRVSPDGLPTASRRWARRALSVGRCAGKKPTEVGIGANGSRLDSGPARRSSRTSSHATASSSDGGPACYVTRDWRRSARRLARAKRLTGGGTVGAGVLRQDFIELTPRICGPHHGSPTQVPADDSHCGRASRHPLDLSFLGREK